MTSSKVGKWLSAALVTGALSIGGGLVLAQQAPDAPPGDPAGDPAAPPSPPPGEGQPTGEAPDDDVQTNMAKRAEISPNNMTAQADGYLKKMRDVLNRVVELQTIARKQKDVIKLNCVNDKLLQIKQLLNIGESNRTSLGEAIARDDESGRYDFFSNVTITHEQVVVLGSEAEQCIGEDLSFLGPTETTVEGGNEPDDPTKGEEPGFPEVEPLPVASPYT